ncbi:unnamed protein product [Adineta steineri]|uniref:F-box domain-containing protein n=1 Tax=Adineta steineri TaxID=433720 RepID=A0A814EVU0_9BILA|nr:unnamed protein product [Adineta steineri]CAF0972613.1 unnamed protein product [Adineta steineri]
MVDTLPNEILEYIFLYVEPCDLFSLRAVCWKWYFPKLTQGVNTKYSVPVHLQGSGDVVLYDIRRCMAVLPVLTCSFHNRDYSISMWLHLDSNFDTVSFTMKLNGFMLELTLSKQNCQLFSSYAGVFEAEIQINIPNSCWFHITLTYSSSFQLYINGIHHTFVYIKRSLSENELLTYKFYAMHNGYIYLVNSYKDKFLSVSRCADIQILPCALSVFEIRSIINQNTCMKQLNMGQYLINRWNGAH